MTTHFKNFDINDLVCKTWRATIASGKGKEERIHVEYLYLLGMIHCRISCLLTHFIGENFKEFQCDNVFILFSAVFIYYASTSHFFFIRIHRVLKNSRCHIFKSSTKTNKHTNKGKLEMTLKYRFVSYTS